MPQNPYDKFIAPTQPSEPANKYDVFLEEEQTAQQKADEAKANLEYAIQKSPDDHARALKAQTEVGLPIPIAEDQKEQTSFQLRLRSLSDEIRRSPDGVRNFFGGKPDALAVAQDDIGILSKIVPTLTDLFTGASIRRAVQGENKFVNELPYTASVASAGFLSGVASTEAAIVNRIPGPLKTALQVAFPFTWIGEKAMAPQGGLEGIAKEAFDVQQALRGDQEGLSGLERGILSGVESTLQNAPGLIIGALTGAPVLVGGAGAFTIAGGQSRSRALAGGATEGRATAAGAVEGSLEAVTEALPLSFVGKYFGGKIGLAKLLGSQLATENAGEQIATFTQDLSEQMILHPDKTLEEFIAERPEAAKQTFIATMTGVLLQTGALGAVTQPKEQAKARIDLATEQEKTLTQLDQLAQQSKTRGRSPEIFNQLIAQNSKGEVRINAVDLMTTLQEQGVSIEDLRAKMPTMNAQINDAYLLGGDVVIPVNEWMTGMAGEKFNQALLPKTRVGDSEMSGEDAKEAGDGVDEANAALEEAAAIEQIHQERQVIQEGFASQLVAARPDLYTPEIAQANAALMTDFYSVLAQKLKVTPAQAFAQFPAQVGEQIEGETLNQKVFHGTGVKFDKFDLDKIGTGQGTQVYGHGLYFTSNKDIGEYYKATAGTEGTLMEVEIPENEDFLDWDKSFAEQSDKVQAALQSLGFDGKKYYSTSGAFFSKEQATASGEEFFESTDQRDQPTGKELYEALASKFAIPAETEEFAGSQVPLPAVNNDKAASDALKKAGVVGNTYKAGQIHAKDVEGQNYVLFDDNAAEITQFLQDARGSIQFAPDGKAYINLTKAADMSTFLHEAGHLFLKTYQQIASSPNAPQDIKDDFQAVLDWTGEDITTKKGTVAFQEKFAEGFETYLFQGKAPNDSLRSAFRMFSDWLRSIYTTLTNMSVTFSPEVTQVVNRMIAADSIIDIAETQLRAGPMFDQRDKANLTDEEWADYQALGVEATQKSVENLQRRSLRDMQWLRNFHGRELKRLQKQTRERRAEVRESAEEEVNNRPERRVESFLRTGEFDGLFGATKMASHKLDRATLEAMYKANEEDGTAPDWRNLKSQGRPLVGENGLQPDDVAKMAGFKSGDEMVRKLANMGDINEDIEALTDLVMLETYGDIYNPETLQRAADIAVHNDARIKMAATELKALSGSVNINDMTKAARRFASEAVSRKQVGRLRQRDFQLAESRSAKKSLEALAKGDLVLASMHKRNQILNGIASKYAGQAIDEIKNQVAYVKKFRKPALKDAIGRDTVEQVVGLLEKYGFREPTDTTRPPLGEWMLEQAENSNLAPDVMPWIHVSEPQQYTALTVEQFGELMDAIKSIEEVGRNRQKMLKTHQAQTFAEAEELAVSTISQNAKKTIPQGVTPASGFIPKMQEMAASITLFDFVMREFDGWQNDGPMYNMLVRSKNEATDYETNKLKESYRAVNKLGKLLDDGPSLTTKVNVPGVGTLTRGERIKLVLYSGTKESYQRLIDGGIYSVTPKLTPQQIQAVVDTLTKNEMDYVQGIWDFFESFWPEISAKEKRLKGFAPKKVDVIPILTKHGEYRGGYMPIQYDYRGFESPIKNDSDAVLDKMRTGRFVSEVTAHGFTKERVAELKDRPVSLELNTISRHIQTVVHDLAFHEWAVDAHRILHSKKVAGAIREHYGEAVLKKLKEDVKTFVIGDISSSGSLDRAARYLMKGSAVATLAFSINTAMMQPLGVFQAIPRIGVSGLVTGMFRQIANTATLSRASTYIRERSPFMANYGDSFVRELTLFRDKISTKGKVSKAVSRSANFIANDVGFAMARGAQAFASNMIWLGAEYQANKRGLDPEASARFADQTVRDTQGSGLLTDRTTAEFSTLGKLFTMYWSYFSRTYNLSREIKGKTRGVTDLPMAAYYFSMMIAAPAAASQLIFALTRGEEPEEELTAGKYGQQLAAFMLNMVPVLREASGAVQGFDYKGPAAFRFFSELSTLVNSTGDALDPEADRNADEQEKLQARWWKAFAATTGVGLQLPVTQLDKTLRGTLEYLDSEENPEQILFGPKVKAKR